MGVEPWNWADLASSSYSIILSHHARPPRSRRHPQTWASSVLVVLAFRCGCSREGVVAEAPRNKRQRWPVRLRRLRLGDRIRSIHANKNQADARVLLNGNSILILRRNSLLA